jgi:MFS family permease
MSTSAPARNNSQTNRSLVPARMDRLPWTRFHWMVIVGLGISWVLDGLEIQIVSNAGFAKEFHMNAGQVGWVGTIYLVGEVVGALVFGRLSDKLGRRKLFILTLVIYLVGSGVAGLSPAIWFLFVFRFIAGMGIGGEYAAINSAIDELIPAKFRGRVDIAVNGTYWGGALIASVLTILVVNHLPASYSWRVAFLFGPVLGFVILFVRKNLPESPRWLLMHGREPEAESAVVDIERRAERSGGTLGDVDESKAIEITPASTVGFVALARTLFVHYPRRAMLGATLMITQSFLYNAIFFTYALVLTKVYGVPATDTAYYFIFFALGNLLGPLTIGHLFDTIGRRRMIAGTYILAGGLLAFSAVLFNAGVLNAVTQTACWCVIFFFASAGASSAYLTVSEIFPVEVRAKAIAVFFAIAQSFGAFGPWLYGELIGNGQDHVRLFIGYLIGAGVMAAGGVVEIFLGIDAERQSLEDIAQPLSATGPSPHLSAMTGAPRPPTARSTSV